MLRIWGRRNSINVQKVLWAVVELGLAHTLYKTGGGFGGLDDPGFRAMNPNGLIPVIEDDGFVLWESNAIVRYLAAREGAGMLPGDLQARASAERWMDWQATALWPAIRPVFWSLVRTRPEGMDDAALDRATASAEALMGLLDTRLGDAAFVNGDAFSVADIAIGVTAARWVRLPRAATPRPHVAAYLDRLRARPAFRDHADLPLS